MVLGLARGGVPVAAEIAAGLGGELDVLLACPIGTPGHEALGIGAAVEGVDEPVVASDAADLGVGARHLRPYARRARDELDRRAAAYRHGRPLPELAGRDVVLVDDGLAAFVAVEAALAALRAQQPRRVVLAVPVCSERHAGRLAGLAGEVVVATPKAGAASGACYDDPGEVADADVLAALAQHPRPEAG